MRRIRAGHALVLGDHRAGAGVAYAMAAFVDRQALRPLILKPGRALRSGETAGLTLVDRFAFRFLVFEGAAAFAPVAFTAAEARACGRAARHALPGCVARLARAAARGTRAAAAVRSAL